ncbi:MAG: 3-oxoacyl-ACP reductase FabG [Clostridia bacterium]|nr:3-oxoacyl-ACP reductase FabG [Clostridia bacterium]
MSKTVFITGGTRGIGRACADLFLAKKYNVVITYEKSDDIAKEMQKKYTKGFLAIKCDVANSAEVESAFKEAEQAFGGVDILINNAGISNEKMLCDVTEDEWNRIFDVNVKGLFSTVKAAMPYMVRQKKGKIINISSIWGMVGASCEVAYSTTKAAVMGFTKALAKELGPSGICVNCVAPGVIDTDMNKVFDEEVMDALKEETPLGKIGTPEDVAKTVEFLAEDGSDFITGQVISPNGGIVI